MSVWSKGEIEVARYLWDVKNLSARMIGLDMGRSKGSIIGIAHRNNFRTKGKTVTKRLSEEERIYRLKDKLEKKRLRQLAKETKKMELAQKAIDKAREIDEELKKYENIDISKTIGKDELNDPTFSKQCRFVIGDPRNIRYCGMKIKNGAYCKHHYKVCHASK